jgi:Cytochrome b5-like Heme/Steroid binding domain/F-box domain
MSVDASNNCSGDAFASTRLSFGWSISGPSFYEVAYWYAYGLQILLLVTLLAITIYRKEMSCNRCYAEQEENGTARSTSSESRSTASAGECQDEEGSHRSWDYQEAESLLEEAGRYCSGACNLLVNILKTLHKVLPKAIANAMWESLSSWWVVAAEGQRLDEILNGAGNWCVSAAPHAPPTDILVPSIAEDEATHGKTYQTLFPAAEGLPADATVHILSFLHPKDILSFACTSQQVRHAVDDEINQMSTALWKTLWYRDYAWIVESWDVGREAANRSFQSSGSDQLVSVSSFGDVVFTKEFYFRFGLSYLNYVLAGHCNAERCLIGLGGHIYDLTGFLNHHPGSPETVMVHAGRDASAVFQSMRHTVAARKLAQQLCVAVDMSQSGGAGVRPTRKFIADIGSASEVNDPPSSYHLPSLVDPVTPHGCPQATVIVTVETLRDDFMNEQAESQRRAARLLSRATDAILGEVHAYYDPFHNKWKAWYINTNFDAVFVEDL